MKTEIINGKTVELKKSGKVWLARCPYHQERTGSFALYDAGEYRCFGCGAQGKLEEAEQQTN